MEFTRVNSDVYGNPRYAIHFLNLLTDEEKKNYDLSISEQYNIAIKRANKIGGRKFHNKQYGGGIVFQSYNIKDTEEAIKKLINN